MHSRITFKDYANLNRCVGSNGFNDLSNRVRFPNKTKYLNIHVSNITAGINESKTYLMQV